MTSNPPEVAYFTYMRNYLKKHNFEYKDDGIKQVGHELRPFTYDPNYEFFVPSLVCWEHPRPKVNWAVDYNRFTTEDSEELEAFTCTECNLLDPVSFKRCPNCTGAFYDLFRHPYQVSAYHHCWNCLEGGSSKTLHGFYRQYSKLAPPEKLIPPLVTEETRQAKDDDFFANLQRLLDS